MSEQSGPWEPVSSEDPVENGPTEDLDLDEDDLDGSDAGLDEPAPRTGNHRVDAVLDATQGLDTRPVDEHVAIFERAHEDLRAALDAAPDPGDQGDDTAGG